MAVITSARMAGSLADAPERVALDCEVDRSSALAVLDALHGEGIPAVGVSYGGNVAAEAVMPMDWGTLIPCGTRRTMGSAASHRGCRACSRSPGASHVTAGGQRRMAANSDRRIA